MGMGVKGNITVYKSYNKEVKYMDKSEIKKVEKVELSKADELIHKKELEQKKIEKEVLSKIDFRKSYINIHVTDEDELYNSFDSTRKTLSDEVINYIEREEELIPIYNKIEVNIETDKNIDLNNFNQAYDEYFEDVISTKNKQMKFNNLKKVWLGIIGMLFIIASITLTNMLNTIITDVLSIIGSFAIWEVADLIILGNKEIKLEKFHLAKLLNANIKEEIKDA